MNTIGQNQKGENNEYHLIDDDIEMNKNYFGDYNKINLAIRLGFIRKVYSILSFQLLLSTIMCGLSMSSTSFLKFQNDNFWLLIVSLVITIILPCFALCFNDLFRKVPSNYIFLFTFTFFESYIISYICGMSNPRLVFMAATMTFAMVLGLTVYAATTKHDITMQGGFIMILGLSVCLLALFAMFTNNSIVHIFISTLWIVIFGMYLVYDTQLILGNGELKLTVDDYILASFMLYLDVINLFINLLQILNIISGDR